MESLTTEIGPARPASRCDASDWGLALSQELGFKNVHAEEFLPSWERGVKTRRSSPIRRSRIIGRLCPHAAAGH